MAALTFKNEQDFIEQLREWKNKEQQSKTVSGTVDDFLNNASDDLLNEIDQAFNEGLDEGVNEALDEFDTDNTPQNNSVDINDLHKLAANIDIKNITYDVDVDEYIKQRIRQYSSGENNRFPIANSSHLTRMLERAQRIIEYTNENISTYNFVNEQHHNTIKQIRDMILIMAADINFAIDCEFDNIIDDLYRGHFGIFLNWDFQLVTNDALRLALCMRDIAANTPLQPRTQPQVVVKEMVKEVVHKPRDLINDVKHTASKHPVLSALGLNWLLQKI